MCADIVQNILVKTTDIAERIKIEETNILSNGVITYALKSEQIIVVGCSYAVKVQNNNQDADAEHQHIADQEHEQ